MGTVHAFPRHVLMGRDVPCSCAARNEPEFGCHICEGGLSLCVMCNGAESCLPTDCPGDRIHPEALEAISSGELDYDARLGWVQRDSADQGVTRHGSQ